MGHIAKKQMIVETLSIACGFHYFYFSACFQRKQEIFSSLRNTQQCDEKKNQKKPNQR